MIRYYEQCRRKKLQIVVMDVRVPSPNADVSSLPLGTRSREKRLSTRKLGYPSGADSTRQASSHVLGLSEKYAEGAIATPDTDIEMSWCSFRLKIPENIFAISFRRSHQNVSVNVAIHAVEFLFALLPPGNRSWNHSHRGGHHAPRRFFFRTTSGGRLPLRRQKQFPHSTHAPIS